MKSILELRNLTLLMPVFCRNRWVSQIYGNILAASGGSSLKWKVTGTSFEEGGCATDGDRSVCGVSEGINSGEVGGRVGSGDWDGGFMNQFSTERDLGNCYSRERQRIFSFGF
jgi:hypothetical protein